jgi:hypothetical protein
MQVALFSGSKEHYFRLAFEVTYLLIYYDFFKFIAYNDDVQTGFRQRQNITDSEVHSHTLPSIGYGCIIRQHAFQVAEFHDEMIFNLWRPLAAKNICGQI